MRTAYQLMRVFRTDAFCWSADAMFKIPCGSHLVLVEGICVVLMPYQNQTGPAGRSAPKRN